ncbi:MAG: quinolinate synthase NadA [Candidatus Omnitrophica bacterium]|nr:quinolinate synthase NadA [Candidatus Omnitrophota bacterium]
MAQSVTISDQIRALSDEECLERIKARKKQWGDRLLFLVHNYQRWEEILIADEVGDSLELARKGRDNQTAENIVFCGVHFMAETSRILAGDHQKVFLPNHYAGCPMADMAEESTVEEAWEELCRVMQGTGEKFVPVTYVNSTAALKAFCGRHGGTCVTSSNAKKIFEKILPENRIFFFPDEHLGRNSANSLDVPRDEQVLWDWTNPAEELGGLAEDQIRNSRVLLWKGYCHVHTHFSPLMIQEARKQYPGAVIIAHPECPEEVVAAADLAGSTKLMADYIEEAPAGSTIILATEINHAKNLDNLHADKKVLGLSRSLCPNQYKVNLRNILATLEVMGTSDEANEIHVPADTVREARIALERMLEMS